MEVSSTKDQAEEADVEGPDEKTQGLLDTTVSEGQATEETEMEAQNDEAQHVAEAIFAGVFAEHPLPQEGKSQQMDEDLEAKHVAQAIVAGMFVVAPSPVLDSVSQMEGALEDLGSTPKEQEVLNTAMPLECGAPPVMNFQLDSEAVDSWATPTEMLNHPEERLVEANDYKVDLGIEVGNVEKGWRWKVCPIDVWYFRYRMSQFMCESLECVSVRMLEFLSSVMKMQIRLAVGCPQSSLR